MTRDEEQTIWLAAYNAALAGLMATEQEIDVRTQSDTCSAAADQALADFRSKWPEKSAAAFTPRAT